MSNFRQQINVFIDKELSPEANAQRLIQIAKDGLAEAQASGQAPKQYQTVVDGSPSKAIDAAQSSIYFRFGYALEAAQFALDYLRVRAQPSQTGKYASSFWVSIDGQYVPPGSVNAGAVTPFAEIVIGNTQPYNRRIDVQQIGGHRLRYRTPPGLWDDCVSALKRQFGDVIAVKRAMDYNFPNKYRPVHSGFRYQSPVIIVNPQT